MPPSPATPLNKTLLLTAETVSEHYKTFNNIHFSDRTQSFDVPHHQPVLLVFQQH